MLLRKPAKLLRLHFSEADLYNGSPLYEAIVKKCQDLGIAGITVLRGMEGYGEKAADLHKRRILAHNLPIIVTVVETEENIARLMPEIEKMVDTGMIAISSVEMIRIENSPH